MSRDPVQEKTTKLSPNCGPKPVPKPSHLGQFSAQTTPIEPVLAIHNISALHRPIKSLFSCQYDTKPTKPPQRAAMKTRYECTLGPNLPMSQSRAIVWAASFANTRISRHFTSTKPRRTRPQTHDTRINDHQVRAELRPNWKRPRGWRRQENHQRAKRQTTQTIKYLSSLTVTFTLSSLSLHSLSLHV